MKPFAAAGRALRGLPVRRPRFEGPTLGATEERLAAEALAVPSDWRNQAPVRAFETAFARRMGVQHANTFLGGRVALSAAIAALGLRKGDEVVVPAYTCVVVPNAFRFAGVTVRYADIEPDTYGLEARALRAAIGPRTKAVLLHHLYGLVARDHVACHEIARERGLAIIEDCAQATGATWQGRPVGSAADIAIHSLERTKVITTIFGGVATTTDAELAQRLAQIQARAPWPHDATTAQLLGNVAYLRARTAGSTPDSGTSPWVSTTETEVAGRRPDGYGCRLPAPLARIGLAQLDRLDAFNERRRRRARRWDRWADEQGLRAPQVLPGSVPAFLRYPVQVGAARKQDLSWGARLGIRPGVWFVGTEHPRPGVPPGFPVAAEAAAGCVNLPTLW